MDVRWAALTDIAGIYQSELDLFRTDYLSRGKVVTSVRDKECLVCEFEKDLAGYVMFRMGAGKIGSIYQLVVLPHYRGMGFGRNLVSEACARLSENGARKVQAYSPVRNRVGIFVYRQCGFMDTEIVTDFYETGDSAVLMVKELT